VVTDTKTNFFEGIAQAPRVSLAEAEVEGLRADLARSACARPVLKPFEDVRAARLHPDSFLEASHSEG